MDKLNLGGLSKCDQDWAKMSHTEKGRLCGKCSKVIHDFRNMSNDEVNRLHLNSKEAVCGIYSKKQLQKPIPTLNQPKRNIAPAILSLSALIYLQTLPLNAQTETPKTEVSPLDQNDLIEKESINKTQQKDQDPLFINGSVYGQEINTGKKEPLPFAAVIIEGTKIGTNTDFDGKFTLDLSELNNDRDSITIIVNYVGYGRMEKRISLPYKDSLTFDLPYQDFDAFYVIEKPWYKRVWDKVKTFTYRATHFRRE